MNHKENLKLLAHINSKIKYIKNNLSQDEINSFNTTDYKQIAYCIENELSTVPVAKCGNNLKYHSGKFLSVCVNYKLGNNNSCIICHDNKTKTSTSKIKNTSLKKYGTEYPNQNKEVKDKIRENSKFSTEELNAINEKRNKTYTMNNSCVLRTPEGIKHIIRARELKRAEIDIKKHNIYYDKKVQYVNTHLDSEKFEVLELIVGTNNKCLFKCKRCSTEFYAYSHWKCRNVRCLICDPDVGRSKMEFDVIEDIKNIKENIEIIENNRAIIFPYEIDILIPEYKLGIEINGKYWHSSKFKEKGYHQNKVIECKKNGIKLITLYDYEWDTKYDIVRRILLNSLSCNTKIHARKCSTKVISSTEANNFVDEYHIQGRINSSINLGLYYNDELVSVMTFGKARFNKKYEYEILRFCSKGTIVGGGSKLLKYFEINYKPESLITYADLRWGYGDSYIKMGFEFSHISKPNYYYVNNNNDMKKRYECQKHKLLKKYGNEYSSSTEDEIMSNFGYYKIYDCGNSVYIKNYKD